MIWKAEEVGERLENEPRRGWRGSVFFSVNSGLIINYILFLILLV